MAGAPDFRITGGFRVLTPRHLREFFTFEKHFQEFCATYEETYAESYGEFRLDLIKERVDRLVTDIDADQIAVIISAVDLSVA